MTFEFEFGDGTSKILHDVDQSQTRTVTQPHVYHAGE